MPIRQVPKPIIVGSCFYTFLLVYRLLYALFERQAFSGDFGGEWSDITRMPFFLLLLQLSSKARNLRTLYFGFYVFIALILITGFLSAFGLHNSLLSVFAKTLPKEMLFTWQGMDFYRPSGFIRVLLSYGGMLMMLTPFLIGSLFYLLFEVKAYFASLFLVFLNCCSFFLMWLNGTRSALVGLIFCMPLAFYFLKRDFFAKGEKTRGNLKSHKSLGFVFLFAAIALLSGILYMNKTKLYKPLKRYENFRSIIWTQSGQMLRENPILGVGPGNYPKSASEQWDLFSKETNNINGKRAIPIVHAHNDLLHMGAIGGIPSILFFLYLAYSSIQFTLQRRGWPSSYLSCACICFFIAGLAQCYFLASQVAFLFWLLIVFSAASSRSTLKENEQHR